MRERHESGPESESDRSRLFKELMDSINEQGRLQVEMDRMIANNPDRAAGEHEALEQFGSLMDEEIKKTGDRWVAWKNAELHEEFGKNKEK